jgi:hypothetical protein
MDAMVMARPTKRSKQDSVLHQKKPRQDTTRQALAAAAGEMDKIFLYAGEGRCDAAKLMDVLRSISRCVVEFAPQITLEQLTHLALSTWEDAPRVEYWRADHMDPDEPDYIEGAMEKLTTEAQELFDRNPVDYEGYSFGSDERVVSLQMEVKVCGDDDSHQVEIVYNSCDEDGYFEFIVDGDSAGLFYSR